MLVKVVAEGRWDKKWKKKINASVMKENQSNYGQEKFF